jgi:sterol desaturase/sphingolipid hydroxylase (fatty acid hydroxylase superfamily)
MTAFLVVIAFLLLSGLERWRPLRSRVEAGTPHVLRNVGVWAVSAAVLAVLDRPVSSVVARWVSQHEIGLLPALALPAGARLVLGLVILDYMSFVWHRMLHRVPLLWRFHEVHHADLDLDASTALRFHAGEAVLSVPWRCALIVALGVDPATLAVWHVTLFLSTLFHHANMQLPVALERGLGWLIVTPRLHGLHHATAAGPMNSNFSSGLTLWDRLHHTFRSNAGAEPMTIGMADLRTPRDVGVLRMLQRPFERRTT